jgi:hypothetical protein
MIQNGSDSHQLRFTCSNRSPHSGAAISVGSQIMVGIPNPTDRAIVPHVPDPFADRHCWHGSTPIGHDAMGKAIKQEFLKHKNSTMAALRRANFWAWLRPL